MQRREDREEEMPNNVNKSIIWDLFVNLSVKVAEVSSANEKMLFNTQVTIWCCFGIEITFSTQALTDKSQENRRAEHSKQHQRKSRVNWL